ncbi:TnsD family Tn7-like transposition protein [Aneurinibacillus sp. REN35]|uniref:TnsD family Tn7-like transposition protein n=1 Tax=Aneurinibacillus sp. REN35 TaxID=3237286 RepID=UPI00352812F3
MIPFFTEPYPDELIYSAIARYHFYSGNIDSRDTLEELFKSRSVIPSIEIGSHFSILAQQLGQNYSVENILAKHTIYPYYAPFLSRERQLDILEDVQGNGQKLYARLGMVAGGICRKNGLYYCRKCMNEDIKRYGEPYIHREHQLQGIDYCAHHELKLKKYPIDFSIRSRSEYIRFDKKFMDLSESQEDESNEFIAIQVELAKLAYQFLQLPINQLTKKKICHKYRILLQECNLMISFKKVKQNELYQAFLLNFPKGFLEKYDSVIDVTNHDDWLKVITRNSNILVHPFRHLLMIYFLKQDVNAFMQNEVANDQFENGSKESIKADNEPNTDRIERYRSELIEWTRQFPNHSRTQLLEKFGKRYRYLMENDKDWFNANMPAKRRKVQPKQIVDWDSRDREYYKKVKLLYEELLKLEKPVRITRSLIGKRLNILTTIEKRITKLPRTNNLLNEIIESVQEFQIRRCYKAIDQMLEGAEPVRFWKLREKSAIRFRDIDKIRPQLEIYLQMKQEMNRGY